MKDCWNQSYLTVHFAPVHTAARVGDVESAHPFTPHTFTSGTHLTSQRFSPVPISITSHFNIWKGCQNGGFRGTKACRVSSFHAAHGSTPPPSATFQNDGPSRHSTHQYSMLSVCAPVSAITTQPREGFQLTKRCLATTCTLTIRLKRNPSC